MDLRDYVKIIMKRWPQGLLVMAVIAVFYGMALLQKPRVYTAASTVMMREPSFEDMIVSNFSNFTTQGFAPMNQIELMKSQKFADDVAGVIKKNLSFVSAREVQSGLSVNQVEQTNLIRIVASSSNPEKAVLIAKYAAIMAKEQNQKISRNEYEKASDYLKDQTEKYRKRLLRADTELRKFNQQFGVVDFNLDLSQRLDRISDYSVELEQLVVQQSETSRLLNSFQSKLAAESKFTEEESVILNPFLDEYRAQLLPLQTQLLESEERYTDAHPKIVFLKKRIETLNAKMRKEVPKFVTVPERSANPDYPILKQQVIQQELNAAGLQTREIAIRRALEQGHQVLKKLSGHEFEYAGKLREKNTTERLYRSMHDMLEQMKVTEILKSGNLEVVDLPKSASVVSRAPLITLVVILLMAFVIGLSVITMMEYIDDTVDTTLDVKRYLNLETIGTIPVFKDPEKFILDLHPTAPSPEVYNRLAFHMQNLCLDYRVKVFVVVSPLKGDGKTLVSSNLGLALAGTGENVLLVDADVRNPTLHRLFRLTNAYGLTSYLSGELHAEAELMRMKGQNAEGQSFPDESEFIAHLLQKTNKERVSVLTSGGIVSNPVELLTSPKLKAMLDSLKNAYSKIIIDTPPLLSTIDPAILAAVSDGVVLVVNASSNHRKDVAQAKKILTSLKVKILGVILNQVGAQDEFYYSYHSGVPSRKRA